MKPIREKDEAPNNVECPLYQRPMSEVCARCAFWKKLYVLNPETGQREESWNCAINWFVDIGMEHSAQQRTTHKEVAELRNEIGAAKKTAAAIKAYEARMIGQNDGK